MKRFFAGLVCMGLLFGGGATASLSSHLNGPTGSIALEQSPPIAYGGSASFATSVAGKLAARSYVYVNVVCLQNGKVVYQASNLDLSAAFTLADQPGDGLVWNGGAANCIGALVYRIDYQKGSSISYLDQVNFDVETT